jgi:hypothetical protein
VLHARNWRAREAALTPVYELVAAMHNRLGMTNPQPATVRSFHDRPFSVIGGERFAHAIRSLIDDPVVRLLPPEAAAIDQFSDSDMLLMHRDLRRRIRTVYAVQK